MRRKNNTPDQLRQDGYTYFAFISYRRTDAVWAAWLKRRLQSYRLPQRTHKKHNELPPRFNSVFLDKTNLTPGLLDEGLREEVQAAKFLIVICSRSAHDKPQYLDQEIQYFLEGGGDPSRIIPFIVDNAPQPEQSCFPPKLMELCRQRTILGANIFDSGRRNAFLKVIAYMHGLKLEEIESDDRRRRRKNILLAAALSALLLAAAAFGAYQYWDYNRPKTSFYLDYAERWGVPEGIGILEPEDAARVAARYALVSSRNKVRELRYENAHGRLLAHSGMADHGRPTRAVYEYAEDDSLDKVTWYDEYGELVLVLNYSNRQTVDLQFEQTDSYVSSAALRANNPLESGSAEPIAAKNTTRFLLDYDDNGFVLEQRYVSNPAYNDVSIDEDGVAGLRYERDELGRAVKLWYLSYSGERGSARYAEDYQILSLGNGVSGIGFSYNEDGELTEYRYLDQNGDNIRNSRGFCAAQLEYDAHHNPVRTSYYDVAGALTRQKGGFAVYELEYDDSGNRVASHFYNVSGQSVCNTDGYASASIRYDEGGRVLETAFFGPDGQPVVISDGYAITRYSYDAEGRLLRQSWFGPDEKPILTPQLCAAQSWEYDENGRIIQTAYYDTEGERCLTVEQIAEKRLTLDEKGRCARLSCYDAEGKPCMNSDAYSAFAQEFDELGNLEWLRFFGTDAEPVRAMEGCAAQQYLYDERGNRVCERYYDEAGRLVLSLRGCAELRRVYDDAGKLTQESYYGTDGSLILLPEGYAMLRRSWDRRGCCLETSYLDQNQSPVNIRDGYAYIRQQYDERGNLIRTAFFGADGKPALCGSGYAAIEVLYDANGQELQIGYFGADGQPVRADVGYAFALYEYDANGNIVTEGYFDENNALALCGGGYALCRVFYDENGPIQADFYDTEGNYLGSQTEFN